MNLYLTQIAAPQQDQTHFRPHFRVCVSSDLNDVKFLGLYFELEQELLAASLFRANIELFKD